MPSICNFQQVRGVCILNLYYDYYAGSANDGLNPMSKLSKFESCKSLLNSRQRTSFIMHLSLLVERLLMTLLAIPTASQNISRGF